MKAHSASTCWYSERWRRVRDFSALKFEFVERSSIDVSIYQPIRLSDAVDISERSVASLQVKLGRLGQIGWLSVIIKSKKRRSSLDLGLDKGRWGDLSVSSRVKVVSHGTSGSCTNTKDSGSILSTNNEMAVVEHHVDPSRLIEHVVDSSGWGLSDDLPVIDSQFMTIWSRLSIGELNIERISLTLKKNILL